MADDRTFITKTAVVARAGWSSALISKLLGAPDQRKKVFGRSIPLALYSVERVEKAEASEEFRAAQDSLARRRIAAKKAVATKTDNLLALVAAMPITVEKLSLARVRKDAIDSYNHRSNGLSFASNGDDAAFLRRIMVNYIRHELTQYDNSLWEAAGKTGAHHAVQAIRQRVYQAIAEAYPALAAECDEQFKTRTLAPDLD